MDRDWKFLHDKGMADRSETEETRQEGASFFLHANNNTADFNIT